VFDEIVIEKGSCSKVGSTSGSWSIRRFCMKNVQKAYAFCCSYRKPHGSAPLSATVVLLRRLL